MNITSEQLRAMNPKIPKPYEFFVKKEADNLRQMVIGQASRGGDRIDNLPIENPTEFKHYRVEKIDIEDFNYEAYARDVVKMLKRTLLGCDITLNYNYDRTVRVSIDWSQDYSD